MGPRGQFCFLLHLQSVPPLLILALSLPGLRDLYSPSCFACSDKRGHYRVNRPKINSGCLFQDTYTTPSPPCVFLVYCSILHEVYFIKSHKCFKSVCLLILLIFCLGLLVIWYHINTYISSNERWLNESGDVKNGIKFLHKRRIRVHKVYTVYLIYI